MTWLEESILQSNNFRCMLLIKTVPVYHRIKISQVGKESWYRNLSCSPNTSEHFWSLLTCASLVERLTLNWQYFVFRNTRKTRFSMVQHGSATRAECYPQCQVWWLPWMSISINLESWFSSLILHVNTTIRQITLQFMSTTTTIRLYILSNFPLSQHSSQEWWDNTKSFDGHKVTH